MPDDCLFCKIVAGEVPATRVHEDDETLAFADLNPQAPTHVLVIPKRHIADVLELAKDSEAAGALLRGIRATVEAAGLSEFRVVFNTGAQAGQTVFHVHAHVLGGRRMQWPPG
ncbi:MAG TPA: histidine triad nucleotide-binding protein [Jatrophihabitantaceae bacterium]|jgi:histidine triad (HIT) family protein